MGIDFSLCSCDDCLNVGRLFLPCTSIALAFPLAFTLG